MRRKRSITLILHRRRCAILERELRQSPGHGSAPSPPSSLPSGGLPKRSRDSRCRTTVHQALDCHFVRDGNKGEKKPVVIHRVIFMPFTLRVFQEYD